jgi:DNA (cytosine-5)-methyltransferase 1
MSDGFTGNPNFKVVAGVEIEPDFADEFAAKHPEADVFLGDLRRITPEELPEVDVLVAGVPCTDHSDLGRAKKGLGGKPEVGELGDLFVHMLGIVASKMPAACVFENIASYGSSLAGMTMVANLRRLGYHIEEHVIEPNLAWNEPTKRNRWVCIATLRPGFSLSIPGKPFTGKVSEFLDAPDLFRDAADAERIAKTLVGLRAHNKRHAALGHDFSMRILNGSESVAPTICKSYHKVNSSGFFVNTIFGPRMLRKDEIARLQGQSILCEHYATAVAMMGQGVLTRVFREIFRQLGEFMAAGG